MHYLRIQTFFAFRGLYTSSAHKDGNTEDKLKNTISEQKVLTSPLQQPINAKTLLLCQYYECALGRQPLILLAVDELQISTSRY
jgi:hypothetical protein